jgi:hypothetical protein
MSALKPLKGTTMASYFDEPLPIRAGPVPTDFCATHKPMNKVMGYCEHAEWMARQRSDPRMCPVCRRWLHRREFGPGWDKAIRSQEPS